MKSWKRVLVPLICIGLISAFIFLMNKREVPPAKKDSIRVGISLYKAEDTFISNIRKEMEKYAKEYEKESKIKINLEILEAGDSQTVQNRQVERFISLGYDVLCINPVERADVSGCIDMAAAADIPVVFFNREPVEDDMNRSDRLYYIGADARESALLQAKILIEAYKENPDILDLNSDGVIDYVLLEGEPSHQDSLIRTEWTIRSLQSAGLPINKLAGEIANWDRSQGSALMEQWLEKYPGQIELVISNNDDMALGAIDAIERGGDIRGIKLVGIDGTPPAMEALEAGRLFGTVESEKSAYAKAIIDIAIAAARGDEMPLKLERGKYYSAGQRAVTREKLPES